jgi:hypothetical protein
VIVPLKGATREGAIPPTDGTYVHVTCVAQMLESGVPSALPSVIENAAFAGAAVAAPGTRTRIASKTPMRRI